MSKLALDPVDVRILSAVQRHGRLSKSKLAEIVHLSPSPCWARLAKLEAAGVIRAYRAEIALDRIAEVTRVVVTVSLRRHRMVDFARFEAEIARRKAITDCVATGGGMDYVLSVCCADLSAFQRLMEELLAAELGIERYMTYIVTRVVKSAPPDLSALGAGEAGPG